MRAGQGASRLTPSNCDDLLFDDVMWVENAKRDHFDFITKMRDRGIDVVEMHNLLAETLAVPEAKAWILDHQVVPNQVGLGSSTRCAATSKGCPTATLAETLIGGLSTYEFPEKHGGGMTVVATPPASTSTCCRRCRTPSTPATPPAGSTAA